jgi:large subunit ribosomal protein L29
MKKKELITYKNKPLAELSRELEGLREQLNALRWELAQGKVTNVKEIKRLKKTIAQILTIISLKSKTNQNNA